MAEPGCVKKQVADGDTTGDAGWTARSGDASRRNMLGVHGYSLDIVDLLHSIDEKRPSRRLPSHGAYGNASVLSELCLYGVMMRYGAVMR